MRAATAARPISGLESRANRRQKPAGASRIVLAPAKTSAPLTAVTAAAVSKLKGKSQPPGRRKNARATASALATAARPGGVRRAAIRRSDSICRRARRAARAILAPRLAPAIRSMAAPA
jgi:hypothetical protein